MARLSPGNGCNGLFVQTTGLRDIRFVELIPELLLAPAAFGKIFQYPFNGYLIPPAWSLGVEVNFYLVVPILAVLSYRTRIVLAYTLVLAQLTALASKGMLSDILPRVWPIRNTIDQLPISDILGFDLPILAVVVFLLGGLSYERYLARKANDDHLVIMWGIYAFCFFSLFPYKAWNKHLSANEAMMSLVLFAPIALSLLVSSEKLKAKSLDYYAGALSYPLFLTHFLAIMIVKYFIGPDAETKYLMAGSLLLSFLLAAIVAFFQIKVVDKLRYKARGFGSSQRIPAPI